MFSEADPLADITLDSLQILTKGSASTISALPNPRRIEGLGISFIMKLVLLGVKLCAEKNI
jgi:hypothetical protein